MKNKFISLFTVINIVLGTFSTFSASAQTNIRIGEYVQMGTYYGEPILWRCVDIDENGPLILSDKIICIKAFDAQGDNTSGSHSRDSYREFLGSNYWADSNMRSWLNSTESAGNVNWLCGNPPVAEQIWNGYNAYDREAGFLTNFTQSERSAMREVTQKQLLAYPETNAGMAAVGEEQYDYYGIDVANYDNAYAEYLTDKMFLMDMKQVNAVYNNGSVLGEDYYIGELTAECAANSEYKTLSLAAGNKWYSWLRSPYPNFSYSVRGVASLEGVYGSSACDGSVGVRPAFYLADNAVLSGSGTEVSPYTIDGVSGNTTALSDRAKSKITVKINGSEVDFSRYDNVLPFIENDYTLIPIRVIAEGLGLDVNWDENERRVEISGRVQISFIIDSDIADVDSESVSLDIPARIVDDRTFIPLRFVSENMGADVNWDENTRLITIDENHSAEEYKETGETGK